MNAPLGSVFLSYASQDAVAAQRICEALRAGGIEVWFDQSELRGGDAWDQKIRQQIRECALFLPVISENTASRLEGYFRLEWALAEQRSQMIARTRAFIVPVCVDGSAESRADLPESFTRVQWTRLPGGECPPAFVERVSRLLAPADPSPSSTADPARLSDQLAVPASRRSPRRPAAIVAVLLAIAYFTIRPPGSAPQGTPSVAGAARTPAADADAQPAQSIGVLPFVNMSSDKEQEYFSDGLSEELIDLLGKVPGLRVPARTSTFYFKGKQSTLAEVGNALHVSHVLEGSVRKSGNALRITAELIRVSDEARVWSQTFDRHLDDIFKVQDDIAGAVVKSLKISLLADQAPVAASAVNTDAYTLYLQAKAIRQHGTLKDFDTAIKYLEKAVSIEPAFAAGWAALADLIADSYGTFRRPAFSEAAAAAHAAATRALAIEPNLASAHVALGRVAVEIDLDWDTGRRELLKAHELDPSNGSATRYLSYIAGTIGDTAEQRRRALEAIAADPLDYWNYFALGLAGYSGGNYDEAEANFRKAIEFSDQAGGLHSFLARLLVAAGKPQAAFDEAQAETSEEFRMLVAPIVLDARGRRAEADVAFSAVEARFGGTYAVQIALAYAGRGDKASALKWLDRSVQQHDWMVFQRHDPFFRSLEGDPRFTAFLKAMRIPE